MNAYRLLRRGRCSVGLGAAALLLAACAGAPPARQASAVLASLDSDTAHSALPAVPTPMDAPDPQSALDNYRALLDLDISPDIRLEAERRIADLKVRIADENGNTGNRSQQETAEAIAVYHRLLAMRPHAAGNDEILYQLARAEQNSGDTGAALRALGELTRDYPQSRLLMAAHYTRGEILFAEHEFRAAENEYAAAATSSGALLLPARYKLGWSLYKQGEYERSITAFLQLLDEVLPNPVSADPAEALKQVPPQQVDLLRDCLHVIDLSLYPLGGANAAGSYFDQHGEPRYSELIYNSLAASYLEKQQYSDAAHSYAAYITRHPESADAPFLQARILAAYSAGGFTDTLIAEEERYARTYAADAPYWNGRQVPAEILATLRRQFEELARYHHALAQKDPHGHAADYAVAAEWYRKILRDFPQDAQAAAINQLLADALLDSGQLRAAAEEYTHTAYDHPRNAQSAAAAYAAAQTYERYLRSAPTAEHDDALRLAADSAQRFATEFPEHPQALTALTRAAENWQALGAQEQAIAAAQQVVAAQPAAAVAQQRSAWAVLANAEFALGHYAAAERADSALLPLLGNDAQQSREVREQLAASIYKQGEAARAAGDLATAAASFARVASAAPGASITATADYDAAAAYIALQDWPHAENLLRGFRSAHPDNPLQMDVDRKLAVVYQQGNKGGAAADTYARIAADTAQPASARQEAAWQAAQLYDQAKDTPAAAHAYQLYAEHYPLPFEQLLTARERIAELARHDSDGRAYDAALHALLDLDDTAGSARNERSRALAARASLELGRRQAAAADHVTLVLPLQEHLTQRRHATEAALELLRRAADYGYSDITTAADYEIGALYHALSRALLASQRPANLRGEALEQYNLLLEEQAEPFDEKAIAAHELNLQRVADNLYDEWVARSVAALAELAPAQYGKQERRDTVYDSLR